jgi:hypothetical protein
MEPCNPQGRKIYRQVAMQNLKIGKKTIRNILKKSSPAGVENCEGIDLYDAGTSYILR